MLFTFQSHILFQSMARSRCNGKVLCLFLLPCVMVSHLVIYIMVSIFVAVSYSPPPPPQLPLHFVATGASGNSGAQASHPVRPFWNLRLEDGALWNSLQHISDREHNPILRNNVTGPKTPKEKMVVCEQDEMWASQLHDFNTLPAQMKDFVLSMHCRYYPILLNQPNLCARDGTETETPILLMAIKSQVGNFENRQAIRETWGRSGWIQGDDGVRVWFVCTVFLLARQDTETGPHPDLSALLDLESRTHEDILQWDFKDTFFNLTLKDILFWDWVSKHCPHIHFIFKGDDDVFLRTRALLDYLNQHEARVQKTDRNKTKDLHDFVVGDVIANAWPNRQPGTKYYIPDSFYKGTYPAYAGGGGVVYTGSLVMRLQEVSRRVSLFPIDDVYLGMCLHRLGLSPSHHSGFLTFDLPEDLREKPCAYHNVLLVHKRSPKEMLTLWKELQVQTQEC